MDTVQIGRQVIRELMGNDFLEAKDKTRNAFNAPIQEYAEDVCFGKVWSRTGIDRKQRSILNIAMLTALNRPAQLRSHIEGALTLSLIHI